ncbi:ABC transporter ATP-binding protein [Amycolatopsis sp. NPDC098790]|uniref:ABC transporter ATP-binding protein n=1 Tax=Amycolatopsis sp. NPDC098790 TaxID=3363939 RepID=UPI0037F62018
MTTPQAAGGTPLLEVHDLRVAAGTRPLLNGLTFDIRLGETVGIVGESGSGKSLTAKALVDLLPTGLTSTGALHFDGREMLGSGRLPSLRGRDVSLLMQDPFTMLNPVMTAGDHIAETIRTSQGRKAPRGAAMTREVERRLLEVGIDNPRVAGRFPFELSGGMSQRVALAASLAGDPRLLVADEPTTALDATTQKEILDLLLSVQKARQMSLVLITHDLRLAFSVCGRILVMYAGSVVESSPAALLQDSQTHPYTRDLVRSVPSGEHYQPALLDIPGSVPAAREVQHECGYASRCEYATASCRESKPPLVEVEPLRHSACARHSDLRGELAATPAEVVAAAPRVSPASTRPRILEVGDLTKTYGRGAGAHRALAGVSFSVCEGESLGIVGESGSGKTTIAKILLGLEKPSGGRVVLGSEDVSDYSAMTKAQTRAARRAVQCVFQDPYSSLNPLHSIGYTLTEALRQRKLPRGECRDEVLALLDRVGLPDSVAGRRPSALSGGQRQRVAIARALAVQPRLLICDEPVAALDVSVQAQILRLLRSIHDEGSVGLLFITHDLAVVRQVTDRVVVLNKGEIVEHGETGEVLDAPKHSYTQRLVASMP